MALRKVIRNMNTGAFLIFRKSLVNNNVLLLRNSRLFSEGNDKQSNCIAESKLQDILRTNLPAAEYIEVRDISGGCGAMFEISVVSEQFKGMSIVKQHRLVTEALKEEIKDMHGLRIQTAVPFDPNK